MSMITSHPLFPMFVDIKNKKCLVFGGGSVALRKVKTLLKFGVQVHVYAFEYHGELQWMIDHGQVIKAAVTVRFTDEELPPLLGMDMVVCATNNEVFNHKIAKRCKEIGIEVNSATSRQDCTFIFPAVVVRENLVVGVTTSGKTPAFAKRVRADIDDALPLWYGEFINALEDARKIVKKYVGNQTDRKQIIGELTEYGLNHQGNISDNMVETLIRQYTSDDDVE